MNKRKIKLLVPHLSGKGPVWEEYVLKLAQRDDMELWSTQQPVPLPKIKELPKLIRKSIIKRLPSILLP